jgi:DNA-binding transcriptional LysR family regulator
MQSNRSDEEPRWDDVRIFLALHRERTLARAGARLGLDASTLSRRLAALEEDLGARLFDRTPEGLVATGAAEQLLPAAEETERGVLRFTRAKGAIEKSVEGLVRLTAPPGLAETFIAPSLARLHEKHPRIRVELDASTQVADLTRGAADLALRTIRPTSGDLVMTRLVVSRYDVLASPEYATALGEVRDWSAARWIGWGTDLAHIPHSRWLEKHAPGVEPILRSSSIAVQLAAAESGLGVVLLADAYAAVRRVVPVATTRALRARTELLEDSLWLVGHRALREVPRVAAVWDFVVAEVEAAAKAAGAKTNAAPAPRRRRTPRATS